MTYENFRYEFVVAGQNQIIAKIYNEDGSVIDWFGGDNIGERVSEDYPGIKEFGEE